MLRKHHVIQGDVAQRAPVQFGHLPLLTINMPSEEVDDAHGFAPVKMLRKHRGIQGDVAQRAPVQFGHLPLVTINMPSEEVDDAHG
jgi:hypothetical protein